MTPKLHALDRARRIQEHRKEIMSESFVPLTSDQKDQIIQELGTEKMLLNIEIGDLRAALSCTDHEGAKHAAEALMQLHKRIRDLEYGIECAIYGLKKAQSFTKRDLSVYCSVLGLEQLLNK